MTQSLPILVVEDDAALREAVCDTLELSGQTVIATGGGEDALQLLERHFGRNGGGMMRVVRNVRLGGFQNHWKADATPQHGSTVHLDRAYSN